jgi:hypothetical protein
MNKLPQNQRKRSLEHFRRYDVKSGLC